jgi:hypothetical protein
MADEAMHLLRTAPFHVIAAYYVGSVPFIIGFLYFWADMSRSAFAAQRCVSTSLGLAVLFIWMKSWHTIFARELKAVITQKPAAPWTLRRLFRLASVQTFVQPSGLLTIPAALFLLIPFGPVYAFYQNVMLLGDGESPDIKTVTDRAWVQAKLWPVQNHLLMWLFSPWVLATGLLAAFGSMWMALSITPELHEIHGMLWFALALLIVFQVILPLAPFGCVVAGNIAIAIVALPNLLKYLFGVETTFTLSGLHAILNTTFLMTVYGLSYLCLDPLMKAAYVLRCFYGESQQTGEDLRAELRSIRNKE